MFVKRLEISGFKSFAEKTVFALTPGVTVVVGPNGCGKSNITDAIRWVLGEQSARHLRGVRMDDVIFNGSASRKPLNFAEVSVTFDHTDGALALEYQEVTITRRIYRNGESEYMINKRPCRLKDILELFMDSGIGKEAYSIIGQGRVDEIIHAKPEERRQIFEEAAGILKYKNRKREAQRRLTETAENLVRVGDIISELSLQLDPLSSQSQLAQKYLELRGLLKNQEIDMLVADARDLRQKWYETDKKAKAAADELLEQQTTAGRSETMLVESQIRLDEAQAAVTAGQRHAQSLSNELERLQGQIALLEEKINHADKQRLDGVHDLADLYEQEQQLNSEKQRIEENIAEAAAAIKAAMLNLESAQQLLDAFETSAEALRQKTAQQELDSSSADIRNKQTAYDKIQLELEQLLEKESALHQQIREKEKQQEDLLADKQKLQWQQQEHSKQKHRLQAEIVATDKLLAQNQSDKWQLEQAILVQEQELANKSNRLQVLQELDHAMAGYQQGVKTILTAIRQEKSLAGIFGTVADILKVPDQYVAAIEAALGAALQNLVTENETVAKTAITYLKQVKGGRATFLPLNILRGPQNRETMRGLSQNSGYIGIAADLVDTEDQFKPVVDALLARIHIVRDMDAALSAAKTLNYRERIVTLDGDAIMPGGAMTGGYDKRQGGVLTRRMDEAMLQEQIRFHQESIKGLLQEKEQLTNAIDKLSINRQVFDEQRRERDMAQELLSQQINYLDKEIHTVVIAVQALATELTIIEQRIEEKQPASDRIRGELATLMQAEKKLRQEIASLDTMQTEREKERRSLQESYTEARVRLASCQQQLEHHEQEAKRNHKELLQLQSRSTQKKNEMIKAEEVRAELNATLMQEQDKAAKQREEHGLFIAGLIKKEQEFKLLNATYREESDQVRQLEKNLTVLERRQARLDMERERLEAEMQAVLDRLRESWELDFATAEQMAKPVSDKKAAQEAVREIKVQIQELGTVNLGAIEEYQRVAERVEFLSEQRLDLQAGEQDLLRIIAEIDSRMGAKFTSSMAAITENFARVFRELFGGGRAALRLTDPDNPLDSGVEIVAQPPGKKLQHMSLLSGGEKALTAIALLFAFLHLRPTPFCILDEIEAALDEANLARFCGYLGSYAEKTQFILITHRKKTMEQADTLYGVTMEESGVSKLISVRLKDAKPTDSASA